MDEMVRRLKQTLIRDKSIGEVFDDGEVEIIARAALAVVQDTPQRELVEKIRYIMPLLKDLAQAMTRSP